MKLGKVNMLSGSITKGLLSMAIPIMIMNVMQTIFSAIDMTVLGKYADDTAVGAVGACGMLITLSTGLLIGISSGANVIVARHIGAGNGERAEQAMGSAVLFSVLGGFTLMIIGTSCAEIFLKWTNCPETILPQAVLYFRMYFFGVPIVMLYNFCASILRAMGDTKRPMFFLLLGGIVKVLLNLFCITVLDMTVDGVALATIVSSTVSGSLALFTLLKSKDKIRFRLKNLRIYPGVLREILYIGIPAGLQSALYSLANVVITAAVNGFGPNATTGISIANQFDGILYQLIHAPSLAIMPYVAQNIGAGNLKRAKKAVLTGVWITVAFGATFGMLSAVFSGQLSSLMSSTPEVIRYSQQKMMIISSTYFICGINEVMGAALRGMGKPIIPTLATLLFMCVLRFFWVYLIFPLVPNMTFLYMVWPIGWILSIITLVIAYFPTMAKLQKKNLSAADITQ